MSDHREKVIEELGMLALRSLITLNAGAFIVLLTFVGNTSADSAFQLSISALRNSLICFATGLGFTSVAIVIAYLTAQALVDEAPPKILAGTKRFLVITMTCPLLALVSFLTGVGFAISGVTVT
ncbi:hypothetical protein SAMN05216236_11876 [Sedimentitalea nanhaiensis]|uniref:Uncharacterized protein n=1 Tax=Sedimentitalea nanhaiensis TaxID=999627 RepID=A0A1I7CPP3_9RHOB|nr:hypothetical protein SAMN05216236_11876 [Sedimentitalea nanhaiensis]